MKFSLRDLFLVTLTVALAVGWRVDRRRQEAEIERLRSPLGFVLEHAQLFSTRPNSPKP